MAGHRLVMRSALRTLTGFAALGAGLLASAGPAGAAGWQPAMHLDADGSQSGLPRAALDRDGDAVVIWLEELPGEDRLRVIERRAGGRWGEPTTLESVTTTPGDPGGDGIAGGDVGFVAAGAPLAAWTRRVGGAQSLRSALRSSGGAWGATESGPDLVVGSLEAGGGGALALGAGATSFRPAGGGWGPVETALSKAGAALAVNASGGAVAASVSGQVCTPYIGRVPPVCSVTDFEAAVRPPGGPWSAAATVSLGGVLGGVAIDDAGTATVLAGGVPGSNTGVVALRHPAAGPWSAPETVSAAGSSGDVGVDGDGLPTAVWSRVIFTANERTGEVARSGRIEASTRGPAGEWSAPTTLASTGEVVGAPRIAVSATGGAIVAWTSLGPGNNFRVGAVARAPDGAWGEPVILTHGSAVSHDVAIDGGGDGIVTWAEVTPTGGGSWDWDGYAAVHELGPSPTDRAGAPRCAPSPAPAAAERDTASRVALTAAQLRTNQRIGQAAIRRLNAVEAWLDGGIHRRDLCGGAIGARELASGVASTEAPADLAEPSLPDPRPVVVAPARAGRDAEVELTAAHLRVNQRISQAAIRRADALEERLAGGLTGGDLAAGAVTQDKLRPRVRITSATPPAFEPARSRTRVDARGDGKGDQVALTAAQLRINQRIAQTAVRRANALVARLEAGLTGDAFADGSITARNLAAGVVRP